MKDTVFLAIIIENQGQLGLYIILYIAENTYD